ncbi:MAG: glycosyltransferase family 2 protein, partial [Chloroflexi bacterium]|nr:glycosyltransferase family 2 protein [Chloroflexota bacterium]
MSLVVAAWNEAAVVERHIESVQRLRYPFIQHVVCAGGSDETYRLALRRAGRRTVVLEQQPGEGKQRALRRAYGQASGDIIFLTDADCVLGDDSFERTLEPVLRGEADAATGDSLPLAEQLATRPFVTYQGAAQVYAGAHAGPIVESLLGRNAAVRRSVLDEVGAFDLEAPTGTDYVLGKALRARGHVIRHVPESLMRSEYPVGVLAYQRQQRRWLRNVLVLGSRAGAWNEVTRALATSLLGAAMLLAPLAGLVCWRPLWKLWLVGFVASAAARLRYRAFLARLLGEEVRAGRLLAPLYVLVDFWVWAS